MSEKWKRIKGEKGYLISSWGRVFSLETQRVLSPYIHKSRTSKYLRVSVNKRKFMVHVLVAIHFKHDEMIKVKKRFPHEELEVDHKDRNTLNPNVSNVRWVTRSQNVAFFHKNSSLEFNGKVYKTTRGV